MYPNLPPLDSGVIIGDLEITVSRGFMEHPTLQTCVVNGTPIYSTNGQIFLSVPRAPNNFQHMEIKCSLPITFFRFSPTGALQGYDDLFYAQRLSFKKFTAQQNLDLSVGTISVPTKILENDGIGLVYTGVPVSVVVPVVGSDIPVGDARSVVVSLKYGAKIHSQSIPVSSLQNGVVNNVQFLVTFESGDIGDQTLIATVDAAKTLNETNFVNNTTSLPLRIQSKYEFSVLAGVSQIGEGASVEIKPSVFASPGCRLSQVISKQAFNVRCVDSITKLPIEGCSVGVEISLGERDGGHSHGDESTRPLGSFIPAEVEESEILVPLAGASFNYQAPEVSQEVIMTLSGLDPSGNEIKPMEFKVVVQASGSETWVSLSNEYVYVIVNGADSNPSHPLGMYGTKEMAEAVAVLGTKFVQGLSPLLNVPPIKSQAASLPMGGLYDIGKNWGPSHCGHRDGKTIDISLSNLSTYEKRILQVAARRSSLNFFYISESPRSASANHWHATLQ